MTPDTETTSGPSIEPNPSGYSPPVAARWGLKQAGAGLALFIVVVAGANLLVLSGVIIASDAALFALSFVGYGVLVATVVYASRRLGQRSLTRDFWLRFRPVDLAIGLGIGLLGKIIGVIWGVVGILLFGVPSQPSNVELSTDTLWLVLNGVVLVAVVAPIVEELFMRGLLMHAIRNAVLRRRGRAQPAPTNVQRTALLVSICGSAVVFMALHLYQATDVSMLFVLGAQTFTLGILNGVIVYLTQRLGPAIVAHIVFNGVSVVMLLALNASV